MVKFGGSKFLMRVWCCVIAAGRAEGISARVPCMVCIGCGCGATLRYGSSSRPCPQSSVSDAALGRWNITPRQHWRKAIVY
jgi:hypothetical protein